MTPSASEPESAGGTILPANVDQFVGDETARHDDRALAREAGVGASYGHGWQMLKRYFGPLFLIGLIALVFSAVVGAFIGALGGGLDEQLGTGGFSAAANLIYQFAVGVPLSYGSLYAYLKAAREEGPELSDLFVAYKRAFIPSILTNLLLLICVSIGLLLLVIPGIIVAVRLSFAPFLVVDEELGPMDAIAESWRRTKGYGWKILGTWLLAIPITIGGLILFIVGVIPAAMWIYLAYASLYAAVTARRRTATAPPSLYL